MASLVSALKEGSRSATVGRDRNLVRHSLIVAQVTMAMVLMIGSGLLLRSFFNLRSVDPGLAADGVTTIGIALPEQQYGAPEMVEQFHRQLRDRIHDVAGARAVGMISHLPLTQSESQNGFWIEDIQNDDLPLIHASPVVMPGYFEAMRIPLITGRRLDDRDALNRTKAIVVSESFARQYWSSTQVLGKRVKSAMGSRDGREPWSVIVGVVGDVRSAGLSQDPAASIYFPALSAPGYVPRAMTVVVSSDLGEAVVTDRVRAALSGLDGNLPVADIRAMEEIVKASMAREAFTALLLAVAAGIALLLGAVGIYGVISYIFAQRAAEIGVRMALGARAGDVVGLVMRQSAAVTAVGIGVGLVASLLVARALEVFLFGVTAYDPVVIASVPLVLFGVAGLASFFPALRAGRTDPAIVMRTE
jgi:predicted permease